MKANLLAISNDLLEKKYTVRLKTQGYSMYPLLKPGDTIYIKQIPFTEVQPSQIVVFNRENRWVAHRLIFRRIENGIPLLKTQGDSCITFDEDIDETKYIGIVILRKRGNQTKPLDTIDNTGALILKFRPLPHYISHLVAIIMQKRDSLIRFFRSSLSSSTNRP